MAGIGSATGGAEAQALFPATSFFLSAKSLLILSGTVDTTA